MQKLKKYQNIKQEPSTGVLDAVAGRDFYKTLDCAGFASERWQAKEKFQELEKAVGNFRIYGYNR